MAWEQRDNSGALFKRSEDERKSERSSQYSGKVMVEGREYYIDAWIKDGQKGKFFSLSFKPINGGAQARAPETRDYGAPRRQQQSAPHKPEQQNGQRQSRYVPQHGVPDEEIPF